LLYQRQISTCLGLLDYNTFLLTLVLFIRELDCVMFRYPYADRSRVFQSQVFNVPHTANSTSHHRLVLLPVRRESRNGPTFLLFQIVVS